jgi:fructuronate reductase
MIDRIVPATTPADLDAVQCLLGGLRDEGAVFTEHFSHWVIEDRFAGARPAWEKVGAQLVADVEPFETAKLRMLNGAHSALAYLGLEQGHEFVHQAIGDPALRPLIERLMRHEAAASIVAAPGQDLDSYAVDLLARFANPALNHRLIQIAMDGSQKIPQRWLQTLAVQAGKNQRCPAILAALGAWLRHVRGDQRPVDDPLAARLAQAWEAGTAKAAALDLLGAEGPLGGIWTPSEDDLAAMGCGT